MWAVVVRAVMRRPVLSVGLSTALLVALALPVLDYTTGEAGIRTLPDRFASGGRGLFLMRELMDEVKFETSERGTLGRRPGTRWFQASIRQ